MYESNGISYPIDHSRCFAINRRYLLSVQSRCRTFDEDGIHFDTGIRVSVGSANIASYFAGQKGRNYKFYTEYSARKEYRSLRNFLFKKSYIDMDYVYEVLSNDDGAL